MALQIFESTADCFHTVIAYNPILFMVWLLLIYMERCKCLFMGIPGVSSFHPIPLKTVKSQKNGVKNGGCF